MSDKISHLEPSILWQNFEKICSIPHTSKHERKLVDFVKQFGEKLGLQTIVENAGNIIIKKDATPGKQNCNGVILQAHLDMVPQKNNDVKHNFENDPIQPYVDGEWVKAKGTTLGADNGIGTAAILSILQSQNLKHGPIEALFTIEEEIGMGGAMNLKPGILKSDIMLNLDSEDEGELFIGCAGGINANIKLKYDEVPLPTNVSTYKLSLTGLKGGHSGLDINLGRGNSNKLLIRFLKYAINKFKIRLSSIDGGSLRNAIPREAFAVIAIPKNKEYDFIVSVKDFEELYRKELSSTETDLNFKTEKISLPITLIDEESQNKMINALYACPNGVIRMSDDMPGLVETSTNLAIVKSENGDIHIKCLLRSSVDSSKNDLAMMISSVFELAGCDIHFDGDYPGWKPNIHSPILKTMQHVYKNKTGKTPEIKAVHAGLECGIIGAIYQNLDMISFGPTIRYPHSPDEKVNIKSVQLFWEFLTETLNHIPAI